MRDLPTKNGLRGLDPSEERSESNHSIGVQLRYALGPFDKKVSRLAWSPDGRMLAVPCRDKLVYLYEGDSGEILKTLEGHTQEVLSVAWSPDAKLLASGGWDNVIRVWDTDRETMIKVLEGHEREVNAVAWSPDGAIIASSSEDETVRLWSTRSWELKGTLPHVGALHAAWSPDGKLLAVGSSSGGVTVWDVSKGEPCRALEGQIRDSAMVVWGPDGRLLASAAKDHTVCLWDTEQELLLETLRDHTAEVIALSFSGDARLLSTKSRDDTVRIWDCDSWQPVGIIVETATSTGWCVGLAFHPNQPALASLGRQDRQVRVWDLEPDILLGNVADPDRL